MHTKDKKKSKSKSNGNKIKPSDIKFPVRNNKFKIKATSKSTVTVTFPNNFTKKEKVSLKVYFNGRYSHNVITKSNIGNYKIKNIKKNVKNVNVKVFEAKKLIYTSDTVSLKRDITRIEKPRASETLSGYLNGQNYYELYTFTFANAVKINLTTNNVFDCDLYANWDNYYSWEYCSESWGNVDETLDIPKPDKEKTLYVLVWQYSGEGNYTLNVNSEQEPVVEEQPAEEQPTEEQFNISWSDGTNRKMALLSGISNYKGDQYDLNYCDEDVTDWYNYLTSIGYECRVLGDGDVGNFPRYDGHATKANMRKAVQTLVSSAKDGDKIVFITSGHGSGDGNGSSYLVTYDYNDPNADPADGSYTDTELKQDLMPFNGDKCVIIDHCFSGGFEDEFAQLPNIFFGATCTKSGYGYDLGGNNSEGKPINNGAFTYAWQEVLSTNDNDTLVNLFNEVKRIYKISDDPNDAIEERDIPVCVCTNNDLRF